MNELRLCTLKTRRQINVKKMVDILNMNRTEQNRTEQNRTEQNRTEQNRIE